MPVSNLGRYIFRIPDIKGEPFGATGSTRRIGVTSNRSVDVYGPRVFTIPADIIANVDQIVDYLQNVVNRHDGIDIANNIATINTMRRITVTLNLNDPSNNDFLFTGISDVLNVILPEIDIEGEHFWVDAINHNVTENNEHILKLGLSDARWTQAWGLNTMTFGVDTILGF